MAEMNFYYLEKPTLLNLKRIFGSGDIPFIRLSKFLEPLSDTKESKLSRKEKIGYYNRDEGKAILESFWNSSEFIEFLRDSTGLKPKLRSTNHISYSAGDYSLLHAEESEAERLVVAYDFTEGWKQEWGGYDLYTSSNKNPLICNRDPGSLMIVKLVAGDLSCTRYISQKATSSARLDRAVYDLS